MVGWHHRLNGHEFEQTLGDGEGQGSLACCRPWVCKELDTTKEMNRLIQTAHIAQYKQKITQSKNRLET